MSKLRKENKVINCLSCKQILFNRRSNAKLCKNCSDYITKERGRVYKLKNCQIRKLKLQLNLVLCKEIENGSR